jgi:hypothetical protein
MLLNDDELKLVISGAAVGDRWPYKGGSETDIDRHLRRAVETLQRDSQLECEADFDHYGSGYASYVDVFCRMLAEPATSNATAEAVSVDGLGVYLSRLTPFAIYGRVQRSALSGGSFMSHIGLDHLYSVPPNWEGEAAKVRQILEEQGFEFPSREELVKPLGFDADIPTVFDDRHVYGALFYWED